MNYVQILEQILLAYPHIKEHLLSRSITEKDIKDAIKEAKADKKICF